MSPNMGVKLSHVCFERRLIVIALVIHICLSASNLVGLAHASLRVVGPNRGESVFAYAFVQSAKQRVKEIRDYASTSDLQFGSNCHSRNHMHALGLKTELCVDYVNQHPVIGRGHSR